MASDAKRKPKWTRRNRRARFPAQSLRDNRQCQRKIAERRHGRFPELLRIGRDKRELTARLLGGRRMPVAAISRCRRVVDQLAGVDAPRRTQQQQEHHCDERPGLKEVSQLCPKFNMAPREVWLLYRIRCAASH